jgi:hypothetical protein
VMNLYTFHLLQKQHTYGDIDLKQKWDELLEVCDEGTHSEVKLPQHL